jgi:hypothetical protein
LKNQASTPALPCDRHTEAKFGQSHLCSQEEVHLTESTSFYQLSPRSLMGDSRSNPALDTHGRSLSLFHRLNDG